MEYFMSQGSKTLILIFDPSLNTFLSFYVRTRAACFLTPLFLEYVSAFMRERICTDYMLG